MLANTIGCYKGILPETFSIQVDMRRIDFMSPFTNFATPLVEEGGRKGNMALCKVLVNKFPKIL